MSDLPAEDQDVYGEQPDYQASLEKARGSGWDWGSIWAHITGATSAAADAGYTQPEIDQHLGFTDPAPFENAAKGSWASAMATDPGLVTDMANGNVNLAANPNV